MFSRLVFAFLEEWYMALNVKSVFCGRIALILIVLSLAVAAFGVFTGSALVAYIAVAVGGALSLSALLCGGSSSAALLSILSEMKKTDDYGRLVETAKDTDLGELVARLAEKRDELIEEQHFYFTALNVMGNPVLVCDEKGRITVATKSLYEILEKPRTQVIGFTVGKAFYNKEGQSLTDKVLNSGKPLETVSDITLWNGKQYSLKVFAEPIKNRNGDVTGAVVSFVDLKEIVEGQKQMEEQQQRMLTIGKDVRGLAERVASASEELSASADEQARGAQKQSGQTDTVATAMEEMTATVLEVAQNASATSQAAEEARVAAGDGVSMVNQAVSSINNVAESSGRLSQVIGQLDSQAEEIGRIISVINDIADQTNLLALNAAIEAARAGEAGRGFAVVADEVRKLAEKTMTATKEVEEAIGTIQERSAHAMTSMTQTEKEVEESTELSNKAGESLQQIMSRIEDMVGRVSQIATAAEEQSAAAEEISQSIEDIALVAREADEGAGQAAAATRDLAELAQELLTVSMDFSGAGESKLRASDGQMKGVLPKLTQKFVQEQFGNEVYRHMQEEMGDPTFLPTQSYPDSVLHQMAELVSDKARISQRDFFLKLGRFTVGEFHRLYKRHFKKESLKEFYMRMNDLHAQLTKDLPGIKPPSFTYEDKGDRLFMNYRSKRGLFDYFEGILLGAADFKGEKIKVNITPFDKETARAEIHFLK
ncbi:methyl-accepting chemotaxis protein [Salidesulfovibrio brasiliensis]|nr:methyl-accepting chemotaxis protein [Salidesulfovibrio brasiliensis]